MYELLSRILARLVAEKPATPRSYYQRTGDTYVNPDSAMTVAAVWDCVKIISEAVAPLPWETMKADPKNRTRIRLINHPTVSLLNNRASFEMDSRTWREVMIISALLKGNGYSEIQRDLAGRPVALLFIDANRVELRRRDHEPYDLYYHVTTNGIPGTYNAEIPIENMFHLKNVATDGMVGMSTIAYAARSMGIQINAEAYGSNFFANTTHPHGVVTHPGKLGKVGRKRVKEAIEADLQGTSKAGSIHVLAEGATYEPIRLNPEDAQFITTREFGVEDVARWFSVPPTKLGVYKSGVDLDAVDRQFVTLCLMPWITRLEGEANNKLLSGGFGNNLTEISVTSLLRGSPKERAAYLRELTKMGALSINEVREIEGRDPIPGGNVHLVEANNMAPLGMLEEIARQRAGVGNNMLRAPDPDDEASDDQVKNLLTRLEDIHVEAA